MLITACLLIVLIGLIHSYLGEKYLLIRLFRRDNLPKLMGGDWFTKRLLRFAWHLTTVVWWAMAAIIYVLVNPSQNVESDIVNIIGVTFLLSGILSGVASHGKHLSWLVFLAIAGCCFFTDNFAI